MYHRIGQIGVTVFFLLCLACASTGTYHQGSSEINKQKPDMVRWATELKRNPNNPVLLSDIAAYFFETGQFKKATTLLKRAYKQDPTYPQTLYYMGRTYERSKKYKQALRVYSRYTQLSRNNPYNRIMEGRYRIVTRLQMRETMQLLIENEALLEMSETAPKTVAVMPLEHLGYNKDYAPMGKGLAEMLMTDLKQVNGLNVVERIRIQSLIEEMQLGQTGLVQEGKEAMFGKLLGAGKLLSGNFTVTENEQIRMDVIYGDVLSQSFSDPIILKDALKHLFLLQKDLVFQVIDEMGIRLTPEEREKIQRVPTKSIKAFMAYCMGLEMEDQGNFNQAYESFNQALLYDSNFINAAEKTNAMQSMTLSMQSSYDGTMARGVKTGGVTPPTQITNQMVYNRMQTTGRYIGTQFRGTLNQNTSFEADQIDTRTSQDRLSGNQTSSETDIFDRIDIIDISDRIETLPELPPAPPKIP